ncbi:MAG: DUF1592 domain-containing protein [Rhodospirillaceae bacterium]|nr:DUF1592 domain-containing protein [Rhodospirillaceae bacterium]
MTNRRPFGLVMVVVAALGLSACEAPEPAVSDAQPMFRRLTEQQYRTIIADVFGPHIVVAGSFDPILREEELITVSAGNATISASSFEKFEKLAHGIATQVVAPANRKLLIGCAPALADAADDACARQFLDRAGRFLFRRPLTAAESDRLVAVSAAAAAEVGDFYGGLSFGVAGLLVSPHFLFVADTLAVDGADEDAPRLSAYAKAARLSFFLWNTTPDDALLRAAESGALDTPQGLEAQVDRLLASPRLADGVRALFADMLAVDKFDALSKDPVIYPAFDPMAAADAREQLLRTVAYHLVERDADYRTLFETRETFMTPVLGRVYRVPVADLEGWSRFTFPADDARAGIHTLAGFMALHAHPGRSSPTIRGKAVRELLLCQKIPDPPGDVDFSQFNAPSSAALVARERLAAHNSVASCAGCHKLTDGIGLSLEYFDGAGQFRTTEAGAAIDISGDLDGVAFTTTQGLAQALRDHPMIPACLVRRTVAYALAGVVHGPQSAWEEHLMQRFGQGGFRLKPLMKAIALSPNFVAVGAPGAASTAAEEHS